MDKWQKRALEKKKAREKQLRRRLIIGGGAGAAVIAALIFALVPGKTGAHGTGSTQLTTGTETENTGSVYYADGTVGNVSGDGIVTANGSDTAEGTASAEKADAAYPDSGGAAGDKNTGAASAAAADTTGTESTSTADPSVQTVTPVPLDAAAPADAPTPAADRSDFAVDPNNQNWNYDQTAEKTVYLTFDDGPSYLTPQVLDILDTYGIKATFFVTAQNPDYFGLIKEAYDRGNTIGLHSFSHEYEVIYTSTDAFFEDLDQIAAVVQEQIGYVPAFIRFPGGASNEISKHYCEGIMTALSEEVQARGYQYWDWNAATGDGSSVTTEESVANALSSESQTIVLLCHDGEQKETTVEALPAIIEEYQARGYVFKPIDRTSTVVHHEIFN